MTQELFIVRLTPVDGKAPATALYFTDIKAAMAFYSVCKARFPENVMKVERDQNVIMDMEETLDLCKNQLGAQIQIVTPDNIGDLEKKEGMSKQAADRAREFFAKCDKDDEAGLFAQRIVTDKRTGDVIHESQSAMIVTGDGEVVEHEETPVPFPSEKARPNIFFGKGGNA